MSIARFSRPLLSTFVAAAIAIGRLSVAHAAPDACAALTAADISSALGHPVGPPNPGENGEGGGQCEYGFEVSNQPSFNQFAVELYQFKSPAEAQKWYSNNWLTRTMQSGLKSRRSSPESATAPSRRSECLPRQKQLSGSPCAVPEESRSL
jgi:hypothetical protein